MSSLLVILFHCVLFVQACLEYQKHLEQQLQYTQAVKRLEEEEIQRELAIGKQEEALYKQRVQNALANPNQDKLHPKRSLLVVTGKQMH